MRKKGGFLLPLFITIKEATNIQQPPLCMLQTATAHNNKRVHLINLWLMLLVFFIGCNSPQPQETKRATQATTNSSNTRYLNQITLLPQGGLRVSDAYLTTAAGNLVGSQNRVQPGQPVFLHLAVQGWLVKDNLVSPGATQTITTSKGEPVLASDDLFAGMPAIEKKEAANLRLKAHITKNRSDIPYYTVRFRIWDKWGKGEVSGQYTFSMSEE